MKATNTSSKQKISTRVIERRYAVVTPLRPGYYWNKNTRQWDAEAHFTVWDHSSYNRAHACGQMAEDAAGRPQEYTDGSPIPGTGIARIPVKVVEVLIQIVDDDA